MFCIFGVAYQKAKNIMTITTLPLVVSNAFLVIDKCRLLVDTGRQSSFKKLQRLLAQHNCPAESLDYIFITHSHWDHCGNAAALKKINPAIKIIMQESDMHYAKQGKNAIIKPFGWFGKILTPFFNIHYPAFKPDIVFTDSLLLKHIGINGYALHTPGHTQGSASILLENGSAIVGDLIMGAPVLRHKPSYHFFIEDYDLNNESLKNVISRNVNHFYVGHGGKLSIKNVFLQLGKKCFYH
jgi:hydroxyacylglutathione hydrolase